MTSDDDVDEFGRTRVRNRRKSNSASPPARYKKSRRSRSPRKRSRSPRRSSPPPRRDRDRDSGKNEREKEKEREPRDKRRERTRSPPRETSERPASYREAREPSRPAREPPKAPGFREPREPARATRKKDEVVPNFDSAIDNYVNSVKKLTRPKIHTIEDDDDDPVLAAAQEDDTNLEEEQMAKLMGFSGFDSTKGKKTATSSNAGAVHTLPKRRYRQYMNRRGGFNRPLDPIL